LYPWTIVGGACYDLAVVMCPQPRPYRWICGRSTSAIIDQSSWNLVCSFGINYFINEHSQISSESIIMVNTGLQMLKVILRQTDPKNKT